MMIQKRILGAVLMAAMVVACGASSEAGLLVMNNGNTTAQIQTEQQDGMFSWVVDGTEQMYQQWFWFRVGDGPEASIDTLTLVSEGVQDVGPSTIAFAEYIDPLGRFSLDVTYTLRGGTDGSGASDIGELINITNLTNDRLDMSFFQYSDFDLNGTIGGQQVDIIGGNTARQVGGGALLTETVVTPAPTRFEAALFSSTRTRLNDGVATDLNNNASAFGDATWAFQWDVGIRSGGVFQISKDKNIAAVPEPMSLAVWSLGLAMAGAAARRRRRLSVV